MTPTSLVADFLDEYSRRFLYSVLDGWEALRAGRDHPGVDLEILALPWSQWCTRCGPRLDTLVHPFTDAEVKAVFDEISCYLAFLVLRLGVAMELPQPVLEDLARGVPSTTPFGPLGVVEPLRRYDASDNPVALFSARATSLLPQADDLDQLLVAVGATMGRVVEGVLRDLGQQ